MRKNFVLAVILFLTMPSYIFSQACSTTSVGFTPLNDLGTSYFRGYQGGLYQAGSNSRPYAHNTAGTTIAKQLIPLDTNGIYNPTSGRIVFLSIGMSNTNMEFGALMTLVSSSVDVNPKMKLVNGAQGGFHINLLIDSNNIYWTNVMNILTTSGFSAKQVQAVWYKNVDQGSTDTTFPGYPNSLRAKHKTVLNILRNKFTNLKQCYMASRIYAGYATGPANPEPNAYYSGWAAKWVIDDQINGDSSLIYSGANRKAPWTCWGPYLWADGTTPRSDGLTWICPDDYNLDGTHPSVIGRNKVGNILMNFFMNDPASKPWFRKNLSVHLTIAPEGLYIPANNNLKMSDTIHVYLRRNFMPFEIVDSGTTVIGTSSMLANLNFYNLTNGTYYLQIRHRNSIETWSRNGGENLIFGGILDYNMTSSAGMAYGNNLKQVGNRFCIHGGDVNQDGIADGTDLSQADNDAANFALGYIPTDVNGDFIVDAGDLALIDNNAFNGVISITP